MSFAPIAYAAALGLYLVGPGGVSYALAVEAALEGAWAQQGSACEEIFSRSGTSAAFKKPVNVFAPAFIISGNRLRTPQASCTIKSIKPAGARRLLSLQCATAVAIDDVRAILAPGPDGSLLRYLNDHDTAGNSYKRCTP